MAQSWLNSKIQMEEIELGKLALVSCDGTPALWGSGITVETQEAAAAISSSSLVLEDRFSKFVFDPP